MEDAEKAGAQAEENKSLESYDSEMNAAAQNSQEQLSSRQSPEIQKVETQIFHQAKIFLTGNRKKR